MNEEEKSDHNNMRLLVSVAMLHGVLSAGKTGGEMAIRSAVETADALLAELKRTEGA